MPMPLYVDLDSTLIRGDSMRRAYFTLLKRHPLIAIRALWRIATGYRAECKALVAAHVPPIAAKFEYYAPVLDYVRQARADGRRIVLASGTWQTYVDAVMQHLPGLFDAGYGTQGGVNLIGMNKLEKIRQDAAGQPFEYLGDSHADVPIFHASAVAGWVGDKRLRFVPTAATRLHRL